MPRTSESLKNRERLRSPAAGQMERAEAAANLVRAHINSIEALNENDKNQWRVIVSLALNGGLPKEQLAKSFSCNLMTINRWKAGQNAPGPMARKAIKRELMELLEAVETSYAKGAIQPHLGSA